MFPISKYHRAPISCFRGWLRMNFVDACRTNNSYEDAIKILSSIASHPPPPKSSPANKLLQMEEFLKRCNIELNDLNRLKIIHISGTKGKGSTCAFVEAILRHMGFKTGFYSSPHLIHVRERIRINGKPVGEEEFTQCFFEVHNRLQDVEGGTSGFFMLLTILGFHILLKEKVDVAIIETGVGGEYDFTNVVQSPVACGITTLDFDHMSLLGNTIEEIAWQKAGICKAGSVVIAANCHDQSLAVIKNRALERKCAFRLAPRMDEYRWPSGHIEFGISGSCQQWNISLAMQIAITWLKRTGNVDYLSRIGLANYNENILNQSTLTAFTVPNKFLDALKLCKWPGRNQILRKGSIVYYLDGAHTPLSIMHCAAWYMLEREKDERAIESCPYRILLFHCTYDRDPSTLLRHLLKCKFDAAVFCPQIVTNFSNESDPKYVTVVMPDMISKAASNAATWRKLSDGEESIEIYGSIEEAIKAIENNEIVLRNGRTEVLVTGSLYLVGGLLRILEFEE